MKLLQYTERRDGSQLSVMARSGGNPHGVAWMKIATAEEIASSYDGIAGAGLITEPGYVGFLVDLSVEKWARRQGVGRELVARLRALADKTGIAVIYVCAMTVEGENPLPFYLKCGFEQVGKDSDGNPYLRIAAKV
jgi:N-acetylglutamate synthase-like GNAT family acetyltransferase